MTNKKMNPDELDIDAELVHRLLAAQFPQWADLPMTPVKSAGTDNALYRLGDNLVARLPRIHWAIGQVEKEVQWLSSLAPHLPLAIPVPLAVGEPGEGYPWSWSVTTWLEGENATIDRIPDPALMANDLAQFIRALHQIDAKDGPRSGSHNFNRGVPLVVRDESTRANIASLRGLIDTDAATAAWDVAVQTPDWNSPPVWIHGDLQSGNLLAVEGRLSAVIDFGGLGVGDPACDLMPAWNLFSADTREVFRAAMDVDDATWTRGRGWALSCGVGQLSYYMTTNPVLANIGRFSISEVLADYYPNL